MSTEHLFDEKGNVRARRGKETADPQKVDGPVTLDQMQGKLNPHTVAQLQKTVGNTAVQRFLAQRSGSGPTELDDDTTGAINSERGGGQGLDGGMAAKAGGVMGHDFSGVKVHTDTQADTLSRQLGAKAFTTGNDVFFRSGAYDPGSSDGQRLISHELTHVVQQGAAPAGVQAKLSVNDPNDQYEVEADKVADTVMSAPEETAVQRHAEDMAQLDEVEEDETAQMAAEEDELAQMAPEEDELAQAQEEDELEEAAQMQELEEDELAAE